MIKLKLFLFVSICIIALPYFVLIQRRKFKYKKAAQFLGGKYIDQGFFKTGKIEGKRKEKKFAIESIEVGDRAAETHFRTFFTISCKNNGPLLLLKAKFFKDFPNWNHIYKLKEKREEKDFIGKILNANYKYNSYGRIVNEKLDQEMKEKVVNIFNGLMFNPDTIFKNIEKKMSFQSLIQIERKKISLDIGELILDKGKLKKNIDLLEQVSEKVDRI